MKKSRAIAQLETIMRIARIRLHSYHSSIDKRKIYLIVDRTFGLIENPFRKLSALTESGGGGMENKPSTEIGHFFFRK